MDFEIATPRRRNEQLARFSLASLALFLGCLCGFLPSNVLAAAQEMPLGVVILHGGGGNPKEVAALGDALKKAGYLVQRPETCWSLKRFYDKVYNECLEEIGGAIAKLKKAGATSFVVAGYSMGGVAAIAYGATHDDLKGVIAIAPAHFPDHFSKRAETQESIARAQSMVKAGHADEKAEFTEFGKDWMKLKLTAGIYLSFNGPDSPGLGQVNAPKLRAPLLWVAGSADPSQKEGPEFAFAKAPENPLNKYVKVDADHLGTLKASKDVVISWLKDLR